MTTPNLKTAEQIARLEASAARVRALGDALNGAFMERKDEVRALLVALVAREHVLLLGDPGTGKSALTNALCKAMGGTCFSYLFTRFSTPEEVFGPISLKGLENDEYRRVTTGYMPAATVAFADEIFKANSAILNSLLTVLNEREYDNGGKRERIPLEITIGASNEMPDDDVAGALYDRFMLRRWVDPICDRGKLRDLLRAKSEPSVGVRLDPADLAAVRDAAADVEMPDDVLDALLDLKDALVRQHGITASDRRWRKCVKLVRACAAIAGRSVATRGDMMILADALWRKPEERAPIYGLVAKMVAPHLAEAMRLLDAAAEAFGKLNLKGRDPKSLTSMGTVNAELAKMLNEVSSMPQDGGVSDITAKIASMRRQVIQASVALLEG